MLIKLPTKLENSSKTMAFLESFSFSRLLAAKPICMKKNNKIREKMINNKDKIVKGINSIRTIISTTAKVSRQSWDLQINNYYFDSFSKPFLTVS